jgi:flagellar motility protein MotE (MotC chaperone)
MRFRAWKANEAHAKQQARKTRQAAEELAERMRKLEEEWLNENEEWLKEQEDWLWEQVHAQAYFPTHSDASDLEFASRAWQAQQ